MSLYFDTSAIVPLLIDEPASARCVKLWRAGGSVFTSRLAYVEVVAALSAAKRRGRLDSDAFTTAGRQLDDLWQMFHVVEFEITLMRDSATIADRHGLRGYDAVHCASALRIADERTVAVSDDRDLLDAWRACGLLTASTIDGL